MPRLLVFMQYLYTATQQPEEGGTIILQKLSVHTAGMQRRDSYPVLLGLEPRLHFCPLLRKPTGKICRSTLVLTPVPHFLIIFPNMNPKEKNPSWGSE